METDRRHGLPDFAQEKARARTGGKDGASFDHHKDDYNNAGVMDGLPESHIPNVTLRNVDLNGGKAKWQSCTYVDNGVCEGTTNACPPCFKDMRGL